MEVSEAAIRVASVLQASILGKTVARTTFDIIASKKMKMAERKLIEARTKLAIRFVIDLVSRSYIKFASWLRYKVRIAP